LAKVQEYAKRESHALTGLSTGFRDLDEKTSGLQPSDLIIVAARPSMGKTALVSDFRAKCGDFENARRRGFLARNVERAARNAYAQQRSES
jgi:replicative DNA helicase